VWQINPNVPDELCDVIDRLLEKKPARRYTSAGEVRDRLAELLNKAQTRGLGRRPFRALRGRRKRRIALAAAAVASIAAITLAGMTLWPPRERAENPPAADSPAIEATATAETSAAKFMAEIEEYSENELRFLLELAETGSAAEAAGAAGFSQQGDAEWNRELNRIERELDQLEADLEW
jgi:hypothetical protein